MFILSGALTASAQTIDFSQAQTQKTDTSKKIVLEQPQYRATYTYRYARNAKRPNEKRQGIVLLQIGEHYNRFSDYYKFRFDSLFSVNAKQQLSAAQTMPEALLLLRKAQFEQDIVTDKKKNENTIQCTVIGSVQIYQYQEKCPDLKWELEEGDSTIAGYACKKAKTSLFGRDYIAWYAPEVNLPYGPYKFNGLPGLVFQVKDTNDNFEFVLTGLEKVSRYCPIELADKDQVTKTSRQTLRKIEKNAYANPAQALMSGGDVKIPKETLATVNAKPYNPIELE